MASNFKIDLFLSRKLATFMQMPLVVEDVEKPPRKLLGSKKFVQCLLHVVIGSLTETFFSSLPSMFLILRSNETREL